LPFALVLFPELFVAGAVSSSNISNPDGFCKTPLFSSSLVCLIIICVGVSSVSFLDFFFFLAGFNPPICAWAGSTKQKISKRKQIFMMALIVLNELFAGYNFINR
jgi:hypothetical protein